MDSFDSSAPSAAYVVKTNYSSVLGTVPLSVLVARYCGLDRI